MTEPLMPYSVMWFSSTAAWMYPVLSQRGDWSNNYYQHRLGPGTYMIQALYFSTGTTLNLRENSSRIYRFEGGQTGWLRSPMIQITVLDGSEARIDMLATSAFGEGAVEKAALNVYPLEPYKP